MGRKRRKALRGGAARDLMQQNIAAVFEAQRQAASASWRDRLAEGISNFAGSMTFFHLHVVWFGVWILLNCGLLHVPHLTDFDPFPFGLLTMIVSLEAIFLSTFLLITQNRQGRLSERRAELGLQVDMLAEQKATKIIDMLDHIIEQLNRMDNDFYVKRDPQLDAFKKSPSPQEVLRVIDRAVAGTADEIKQEVSQVKQELAEDVEAMQSSVKGVREDVQEVAEEVDEIRERLD
jgi:uncharacterized membrane protein